MNEQIESRCNVSGLAVMLSVALAILVFAGCIRKISPRETRAKPSFEMLTERNEVCKTGLATFALSNTLDKTISTWKVDEDGYGCFIQCRRDGKWVGEGLLGCGTNREIMKLRPRECHTFTVRVPHGTDREWRVGVEYVHGEFSPGNSSFHPVYYEPRNTFHIGQ